MRRVFALLLLLGLVMYSALAYGQETTVQLVDSLEMAGMVKCSHNHPVVLIRKDIWGTPNFPVVLRHEMTHVKQVALSHDCQQFMKKYRENEEFRLNSEMDAYLSEITLVVGAGQPLDALFATISDQLSDSYYRLSMNRDSLRTRLRSRFTHSP